MKIVRLRRAQADVDEIWEYVAQFDPAAAFNLVRAIEDATGRLTVFPHSGSPRPDLRAGLNSIPSGSYTIIYSVGPDSIDIRRVLHSSRDFSKLIDEM